MQVDCARCRKRPCRLPAWIARARRALPVPGSPQMRAGSRVATARRATRATSAGRVGYSMAGPVAERRLYHRWGCQECLHGCPQMLGAECSRHADTQPSRCWRCARCTLQPQDGPPAQQLPRFRRQSVVRKDEEIRVIPFRGIAKVLIHREAADAVIPTKDDGNGLSNSRGIIDDAYACRLHSTPSFPSPESSDQKRLDRTRFGRKKSILVVHLAAFRIRLKKFHGAW